jgi:voltage-gated potassium channel Kch
MKKVIDHELFAPLLLFFGMIFVGAGAYTQIEGWNYLDALYFSVATATTVGYGDLFPVTAFGKIFTIIFAFCTIGFAFYFFTLVGKYFLTHRLKKEILEARNLKNKKGVRVVKV